MNFKQYKTFRMLTDSILKLYMFCFFLIYSTSLLGQSPSVSIFYDTDYVETCQLISCEGYTLKSFLESIDYDVQAFEGIDSNAIFDGLACNETFFLPETESGDFASNISSESAEIIRDYVASGGLMIVMGSDGLLQSSSNSAENLNSIFSFDIENVHFSSSGQSYLSSSLTYPFLSAFPDSIKNFTTTNFIGNLPQNSEVLYYFDEDKPCVVDMPYGDGHIFYLGWSFFNGGPIGSQGPDRWSLLIQVIIENFSPQDQFPNCDYCDTKVPSRTVVAPSLSAHLDLNGVVELHAVDYEYLYEDNCTLTSVKIISDSTLDCTTSFNEELILEILDNNNNLFIDTLNINLVDTVLPEFLDFPDDVTIECNYTESPKILDSAVFISQLNESLNIDRLGLQTFELNTDVLPTGSIIESVEFYISGSFNDVDDLWLSVKDSYGFSSLLYNQECSSGQRIDAWFSDSGIEVDCLRLGDEELRFQSTNLGLDIFKGKQPSAKYIFSIINQNDLTGLINSVGVKIHFSSDLREPLVNEACGYDLTYADFDSRTNCPTGTIIRRFTVVDDSGNTNVREQTISIEDSKPVNITYPDNFFYECDGSVSNIDSLDPELLPVGFNLPTVTDECREYTFNYSDRVLSACGNGNIEIERTWVVQSLCEPGQAYTHRQLVGVIDTVSPVIEELPGYFVYVDEEECLSGSNFSFPARDSLVITDCDTDFSVHMRVIDSNGVEFVSNELQAGNYLVEISVTDLCGNTGYQFVPVQLLDITKPIIHCYTVVKEYQLDVFGEAIVCGAQLLEPVVENCGIDKYQVSFLPTFGPDDSCLEVNCYNLGVKTVYVRVVDFSGNDAVCSARIRIVDRDIPVMTCSDITISCEQPFDPKNYPLPMAFDNCDPNPYVECTDFVFVGNSCDSVYSRQCFTRDGNGNGDFSQRCTQRLTKVDTARQVILWPDEVVQLSCGGDPDPSFTGEPIILAGCGRFDISYGDREFTLCSSPELYGVERRWLVRNLCTQELHLFDQEIRVSDANPPVFTYPTTPVVSFVINDFNCEREISFIPEAVDDCSSIIFYSNSISGNSRELTGVFEVGLHPVIFYVEDICGNIDSMDILISIEENKNPYVSCEAEEDFFLDFHGKVDIFPRQILDTAFDLCTDSDQLDYFISKVLPTGNDIGRQPFIRYECEELGLNESRIYVRDASNNYSYCDVIINVVDTFRNCPFGDFYDINGMIFTEDRLILGGARVHVDGFGRSGFDNGESGYYRVKALPKNTSYEISIAKNYGHDNGVTALDIAIIQRNMLQLAFLSSPYKFIAADVNNDKKVSVTDLAVIRSLLLGLTDQFTEVPSWRFIPELFEFHNPLNPFERNISFADNVLLEGSSINDVNFIGVKMGDVDNSASQNLLGNSINNNRDKLDCSFEYQFLGDNRYLVSIIKPADWVSTQLFLSIDNAKDIEIVSTVLNTNEYSMEDDKLGVIWSRLQTENDVELMQLLITSYNDIEIHDIVSIDEGKESLASVNFEREETIHIKLVNTLINSAENTCFMVFPTIWRDIINVSKKCSLDETFSLRMFDINGQLVFAELEADIDMISKKELRNLVAGLYLVEIIDHQGTSHIFRTIKN